MIPRNQRTKFLKIAYQALNDLHDTKLLNAHTVLVMQQSLKSVDNSLPSVGSSTNAARYRAGNGAVFSFDKIPPGPGLANTCELPFGFVYTPLSPPDNVAVVDTVGESLPAVLCLTCLGYLNLYCNVVDAAAGIWTCSLCGSRNASPPDLLQSSPLLLSPMTEFRQVLPSKGSDINSCSVILVLDANLPAAEAHAIGKSIAPSLLQSKQAINLGLIIFGKDVSIFQLGVTGMASADVFATNEALMDEHLRDRCYLKSIESEASFESLYTCLSAAYGVTDSSASVDSDRENKPSDSSIDDFSSTATTPSMSRLERLRAEKAARQQEQQHKRLQPRASSANKVDTYVSPWAKKAQQSSIKNLHSYRNTGEAIQCAIDLTAASVGTASRTGRIFLFTNGCPNYGDGHVVVDGYYNNNKSGEIDARLQSRTAEMIDPLKIPRSMEYFDILAKAARDGDVGLDVLCTGASELCLPVYQSLVEPSAGFVVTHDSFTTPHLGHNFDYLLQQTHISQLEYYCENATGGWTEMWMQGCFIDLHLPSFVFATHIVGPGDMMEDKKPLPNERSAFAMGATLAAKNKIQTNNLPLKDVVDNTLTRIRLFRCDPLSTFSVMLEVNDFYQKEKDAHFQCTVRFVDLDGKTLVTRICTHRLVGSRNVGEFLDSVDEEVVPVLLGKEAVYRSMYGRESQEDAEMDAPNTFELESLADDAQRDVDATIQRISGAFRLIALEQGTRGLDLTEEGGVKAAGSSFDFAFPSELADALRRLYHLRRGPLLSPGPLKSDDDRAQNRALFLRLPLEDCLCMMAPSLWSSGILINGDTPYDFEPMLPDTLALWGKSIVIADHYQNLFIWSGQQTKDSTYDKVREEAKRFLLERSKHRFPMAQLHILSEGDSMSRRFTSLLAPSHGDPIDHQLANFPRLSRLSDEDVTALRSKYRFYDASSDPSFRDWFWGVASATSGSKDEGLSLCE